MTEHLTGNITIRPFDAERDAERVGMIASEVWRGVGDAVIEEELGPIGGQPWRFWLAQDILAYLQADEARSFVAEQNGEIVGFCSYVIDHGRKRGTVGYNGVARSHQGLGIGSAMLDFVISGLRAEGMDHAVVLVADNEEHLPARGNYEKHGFRKFSGLHLMWQKL